MSWVLQRLPSSPNGQKKDWEHQVLQQRGQTIWIFILLRSLQSCAVTQNAKNKFGEGNESHQILNLDCLLVTKGSFTLTGLVWDCHTIPVVPVLQACFKDWGEAQIGNALKSIWMTFHCLSDSLSRASILWLLFPRKEISNEQQPGFMIVTR